MGAEWIAWTVRLGSLCFVAVLGGWAIGWSGERADRILRLWWTCGWFWFVLHLLAAFHFQHHWSHAQAVKETAEQTRQLIGWEFGGGVYFNYLFLIIWGLDLVLWWRGSWSRSRFRTWRAVLIFYLVFIAFNGIVVFKSGWLRGIGSLLTIGLAGLWGVRLWRGGETS